MAHDDAIDYDDLETAFVAYETLQELPDNRLCGGCRCTVGGRVCRRGEYGGPSPRVGTDTPLVRMREMDDISPRPLVVVPRQVVNGVVSANR